MHWTSYISLKVFHVLLHSTAVYYRILLEQHFLIRILAKGAASRKNLLMGVKDVQPGSKVQKLCCMLW